MKLRPYQQDVKDRVYQHWNVGQRNVIAVMPTGAGKSLLTGSIAHDHQGCSTIIAHRQELVSQMAMAAAQCGLRHRIIGSPALVKFVIQEQLRELGTSYFDPNAKCAVAGVDTLLSRKDELRPWFNQTTLWATDECHHLVTSNKWGKAVELFPNARGLGVTATPVRADGKGLGRHADGVFDQMVVGPSMRDLIRMGNLSDYRIFCPPSDIDLSNVPVSDSTGDYSPPKLKKAVRESHVIGDIVTHYKRLAAGKLAVVFATDLETAADIAQKFNSNGVRAEVVSGKTPDFMRAELVRRFRRRELDVLVNCDLFGEGFDLPAIECVIFARPTQSYGLYCQMFGRALRMFEGKTHAIIIDHVGNVVRHGLPDAPREWSLNGRDKRPRSKSPDDEIPLRPCPQCTRPYERSLPVCPYCNWKPEPMGRGSPEFVDGDLFELDAATLARMRSEVDLLDLTAEQAAQRHFRPSTPGIVVKSFMKQHTLRQEAQTALRASISWFAGHQRKLERSDAECYRRFYLTFGTDIMTAQSLGRPEALALADKINHYIGKTL